jgi:hypothetical protein
MSTTNALDVTHEEDVVDCMMTKCSNAISRSCFLWHIIYNFRDVLDYQNVFIFTSGQTESTPDEVKACFDVLPKGVHFFVHVLHETPCDLFLGELESWGCSETNYLCLPPKYLHDLAVISLRDWIEDAQLLVRNVCCLCGDVLEDMHCVSHVFGKHTHLVKMTLVPDFLIRTTELSMFAQTTTLGFPPVGFYAKIHVSPSLRLIPSHSDIKPFFELMQVDDVCLEKKDANYVCVPFAEDVLWFRIHMCQQLGLRFPEHALYAIQLLCFLRARANNMLDLVSHLACEVLLRSFARRMDMRMVLEKMSQTANLHVLLQGMAVEEALGLYCCAFCCDKYDSVVNAIDARMLFANLVVKCIVEDPVICVYLGDLVTDYDDTKYFGYRCRLHVQKCKQVCEDVLRSVKVQRCLKLIGYEATLDVIFKLVCPPDMPRDNCYKFLAICACWHETHSLIDLDFFRNHIQPHITQVTDFRRLYAQRTTQFNIAVAHGYANPMQLTCANEVRLRTAIRFCNPKFTAFELATQAKVSDACYRCSQELGVHVSNVCLHCCASFVAPGALEKHRKQYAPFYLEGFALASQRIFHKMKKASLLTFEFKMLKWLKQNKMSSAGMCFCEKYLVAERYWQLVILHEVHQDRTSLKDVLPSDYEYLADFYCGTIQLSNMPKICGSKK